jgi:antitoxin component HigA of HigAB toxin-antitoxin module
MSKVQVIEIEGQRAYLVPAAIWEQVKGMVEDAEDAAAYAEAVARDDGVRIPLAVVKAELAGAHPVKAWREHRGLTLQALADAAGVSKPYVSQIEGGKRAGTAATLKKLAGALGVPVDVLVNQ